MGRRVFALYDTNPSASGIYHRFILSFAQFIHTPNEPNILSIFQRRYVDSAYMIPSPNRSHWLYLLSTPRRYIIRHGVPDTPDFIIPLPTNVDYMRVSGDGNEACISALRSLLGDFFNF